MLDRAKLGLASALVAVMMAVGGLSLAASGYKDWGPNSSSSSSLVAPLQSQAGVSHDSSEQQPPSSTEAVSSNVEPQAQVAVLDARSAVAEAGPAVVTIMNTQSITGPRGRYVGTATAVGSGVIIDSRGYIITNEHVVENQQNLEVIFSDGSKAVATVVGSDASLDLAIIKVHIAVPAVAEFGDSSALEPGQPAIAIGTALGDFRNTVTAGVVSALDRDLDSGSGGAALHDLIQTDASINEGNSGGPLIDVNGRVIGINVAVVRGTGMQGAVAEGLGFAISSNTAQEYADQIIEAESN
jgi:2-alkenal reductase